jgi:hypothetical protein
MADAAEHITAQVQVLTTQIADLRVDVRPLSMLSGDVRALTARVDTQLDHGSRRMAEMATDIDELGKELAKRVGVLEAAGQRRGGAVSVLTLVLSILLSLAGSSTAATVIAYILTRHP